METAMATGVGCQSLSKKISGSGVEAGAVNGKGTSGALRPLPNLVVWDAGVGWSSLSPVRRIQVTRCFGGGRLKVELASRRGPRGPLPKLDHSGSSMWGSTLVTTTRQAPTPTKLGGYARHLEFRAKAGESKLATKSTSKMNLDEYMVTLDKPIGIRFAQMLNGKVYVEALAKNGNADKSRLIMVGDVLKKTSAVFGDELWEVVDFGRTMHAIKSRVGSVSLIFERSLPVCRSRTSGGTHTPFNDGRVPVATWDSQNLVVPYQPSENEDGGKVGFVTFSAKYLMPQELNRLASSGDVQSRESNKSFTAPSSDGETFEVISSFSSDEETDDELEWTHGSYNEQEYLSALARADDDLSYNPELGIQYKRITEQIYVGSCIQSESDRRFLMEKTGITAVLNLQRKSEQMNWGIDGEAIEKAAKEDGLVIVNCPIRDVDSVDLRRKLPFSVGILYRLLRQGHRVYVTCTTGLDRSPACVIAYLHWIQDVPLQEAVDYIKRLHPCGPDRPALVWGTWDLIAMVEKGEHEGPPTHAVQFVWNHGCREGEDVLLVGEFKGGWNEPIRAVHAGGPKYTVDLRLPQGKYNYKFIIGGHWRHSNSLPTEVDQWGNVNNVIKIGDVATTKFDVPRGGHMKELNSIKVIERPLTEDERFTLAFAARRMAFAIHPFTFAPKKK